MSSGYWQKKQNMKFTNKVINIGTMGQKFKTNTARNVCLTSSFCQLNVYIKICSKNLQSLKLEICLNYG